MIQGLYLLNCHNFINVVCILYMAFRRKNDNGMNNNDQEYIIQQNEDEEWSEGVPMFLNTTSEEEDTFFHLVNSGDVAAVVRFLNV